MLIDGGDNGSQKQQELRIVMRRRARAQKVFAGVRNDGPVVVLAGTVYAGKRFFV